MLVSMLCTQEVLAGDDGSLGSSAVLFTVAWRETPKSKLKANKCSLQTVVLGQRSLPLPSSMSQVSMSLGLPLQCPVDLPGVPQKPLEAFQPFRAARC